MPPNEPSRTPTWVKVLIALIALGAVGKMLEPENDEPTRTYAKAATPAAENPRKQAGLPDTPLARADIDPALRTYLGKRYGASSTYKLRELSCNDLGDHLVVEVDLLAQQGLTAGTMGASAIREARKLLEDLSSAKATAAVYLYQVRVYLPGSDKYGQPKDLLGVAVTLKSSEAQKVNWRAMTNDRFIALAKDVGAASVHPALD